MRAMSRSRLSRSLLAIVVTLAACADYGDPATPEELEQPAESAPNGDEAAADTGAVTATSRATPDAGAASAADASVRREEDASVRSEAGVNTPGPAADAGRAVPAQDAGNGRDDAGIRDGDAQVLVDASSTVDACDALSYANFGMQFIASYCVGCHNAANAKRGVQLDTLAGVQKNKAAVKRVTVAGTSMPSIDPKPSAADREKLGQWLDCGPN